MNGFSSLYFYYFVMTLMYVFIGISAVGPIAAAIALGILFGPAWYWLAALSLVTIPFCKTVFVFNKIQDNNNIEENEDEDGEDPDDNQEN
jgi:hypothetical protein